MAVGAPARPAATLVRNLPAASATVLGSGPTLSLSKGRRGRRRSAGAEGLQIHTVQTACRRSVPSAHSGMGEVGQLQDGKVSSADGERHARGVYRERIIEYGQRYARPRALAPDFVRPSPRTSCAFHSGPRAIAPDFKRFSVRTSCASPRPAPDLKRISLPSPRVRPVPDRLQPRANFGFLPAIA